MDLQLSLQPGNSPPATPTVRGNDKIYSRRHGQPCLPGRPLQKKMRDLAPAAISPTSRNSLVVVAAGRRAAHHRTGAWSGMRARLRFHAPVEFERRPAAHRPAAVALDLDRGRQPPARAFIAPSPRVIMAGAGLGVVAAIVQRPGRRQTFWRRHRHRLRPASFFLNVSHSFIKAVFLTGSLANRSTKRSNASSRSSLFGLCEAGFAALPAADT